MKIDRRTFAIGLGLAGLAPLTRVPGYAALLPKSGPMKLKPLSKDFLTRLPEIMKLAKVPGTAVAFVENGRPTWTGNFGVMSVETNERVGDETVWQAASLSKPVFALAVMKLVEEKKLDLDRPLSDYIPGDLIADDPRSRLITARHVLSHSSGLQNWRFQAGQKLQLAFPPGERWSYSGEGIYYLQRAVERITDRGFGEFMKAQVLDPLGMTSSSYYWTSDLEKRLVTQHNGDGGAAPDYIAQNGPKMEKLAEEWKKPVAKWRSEDFEKAQEMVETRFPPFPTFFAVNAAGSLFSTPADYARFVTALFDRRYDEMFKPQSRINDVIAWGLGWGLQTRPQSTQFWHWGEGINYRTFVIGDRMSRSAVVVFTNARNGRKIWERIVTEATGVDQPLTWWL